MALSYLSGIINNNKNNQMEDIGIIYPRMKQPIGKRLNKFTAVKKTKLLAQKQIDTITKRLMKGNVTPAVKLKLQNRLLRLQSKLNGIEIAELGKSKRKKSGGGAKRTKAQVLKKLKTTIKKAKERRKADKHSPKEKAAHKIAKVALAVPRGAFLGLILLGKALEKSPVKINLAKNLRDNWSSKGKALEKLWYKLGGEVDILKAQISKATNSKLAGNMGVVVAATTAGSVAAATPILVKILAIIGKGKAFAQKNPKLIAVGEKLMKGKLQKFAAKKGKSEELQEVAEVTQELTENLPQATKEQVQDEKDNVSEKIVAAVDDNATKEVEQTKENIQTESENEAVGSTNKTMMIAGIGAAVLIGGYLLTKKKK
jgi:hypothetical protein